MNAKLAVVNPLPALLAHYEKALVELLDEVVPGSLTQASVPSVEVRGKGLVTKLGVGARTVAAQRQVLRNADAVMSTWPSLGYLDAVSWWNRTTRVSLVIHDPDPIRDQVFSGVGARRLAAAGIRSSQVGVLTHSREAYDAIVNNDWPKPSLLPIPILSESAASQPRHDDRIVVLGQHKPSRDMTMLEGLAPLLRSAGYTPIIAGPRWPAVPGWDVDSRFLSEAELNEHLATAACVVIPYQRFYQSDIAVRALEHGAPIAGPCHGFLRSLYGDWPGMASDQRPESWFEAIEASIAVGGEPVRTQADQYRKLVLEAWTTEQDVIFGPQ